MKRPNLVGKQHKRRRSHGSLRKVINFHLAARWRRPAVQIHTREPAIQLARGNPSSPRFRHAIDQCVKLSDTLTRQSGKKHNRSEWQEFEFLTNDRFVISQQLTGIIAAALAAMLYLSSGFFLGSFKRQIPFI